MRTTVYVMAALTCAAGLVMAQDLDLKPTKDIRIFGHSSETDLNGGASTRLRATGISRASAEFPVMDFDRAALKDFLAQNREKKIAGKLVLCMRQVQGVEAGTVKVEVAALDSASDWSEGAGNQAKAQKGESCALAARLDEKKWTTPRGGDVEQFRDLVWDGQAVTSLVNAKGADIGKDSAEKTVEIELEAAFLQHLATDKDCQGLVLFHRDGKAIVDIYSREQAQKSPALVVKAE